MAITERRKKSNRKYDEKTYTTITIRLRKEADYRLISSYRRAKNLGMSTREWINALYEGDNEIR